ncbi:helix-turn-helix transcriptional regulator [Candidatus Gottesmanbacteria bacterium]|nr:helix-turn-helix transcriptional regulator [Candidatus Gottesmanbacteria bacterium]
MKSSKSSCGVENTLRIVGAKWTLLILHNLCDGKRRFGQLQKALLGISPRTLSLRLHQLEKDGFVTKKIFSEVPLRVEYTLTPKGQSIKSVINTMKKWGLSRE